MTTQDEIRQRAREIWEREGRPEGRNIEHWLQAESELNEPHPGASLGTNIASADESMLKVPPTLENQQAAARKRPPRRKAAGAPA
ncbi:MAG: DUF2934 domain-containing protein [Verrucomicrobiota bacterium]